jgi:hypothetical protein
VSADYQTARLDDEFVVKAAIGSNL